MPKDRKYGNYEINVRIEQTSRFRIRYRRGIIFNTFLRFFHPCSESYVFAEKCFSSLLSVIENILLSKQSTAGTAVFECCGLSSCSV